MKASAVSYSFQTGTEADRLSRNTSASIPLKRAFFNPSWKIVCFGGYGYAPSLFSKNQELLHQTGIQGIDADGGARQVVPESP